MRELKGTEKQIILANNIKEKKLTDSERMIKHITKDILLKKSMAMYKEAVEKFFTNDEEVREYTKDFIYRLENCEEAVKIINVFHGRFVGIEKAISIEIGKNIKLF